MEILRMLDDVRRRVNVLEHPFYERWTAGELTQEELALYAAQYRHAVVALADASALAAERADAAADESDDAVPSADSVAGFASPADRDELIRHAEEERMHIGLWDDFAAAVGAAPPEPSSTQEPGVGLAEEAQPPLPSTLDCVRSWTAGDDLLEHLAVLYAIEASQPAISHTKLDGLTAHYGLADDAKGRRYFEVHSTRDVEHARQAGELLASVASEDDKDRLLARATAALEGNWRLLDGVEAQRAVA